MEKPVNLILCFIIPLNLVGNIVRRPEPEANTAALGLVDQFKVLMRADPFNQMLRVIYRSVGYFTKAADPMSLQSQEELDTVGSPTAVDCAVIIFKVKLEDGFEGFAQVALVTICEHSAAEARNAPALMRIDGDRVS